ncbi:MAG TPA: DUF1501 domain-containing protein [Planctomycetaceae bacterium]|nr:DUF1501 domain-containing protein [Planctomycetaceae bacterium]
MLRSIADIGVTRQGVVSRRGFLAKLGGATVAGGALTLGWRDMLIAQADELRKRGKSMILLWMDGGPSQYETFNPKIGSKYQGPAGAISTAVPGLPFADFWPNTATALDRIAIVRSMVSKEAEHDRAIALVRTGYPLTPAVRYPTFGAVVARERQDAAFDLPAFVRIGRPRIATRDVDAGVLGTRYSSFNIEQAGALPANVRPIVARDVLRRRLDLAAKFDGEFARQGGADEVLEKQNVYDRTARFVLSPRLNVFDLDEEPESLRDRYGRTDFGQGCLLARRLVERGVSFIEVLSTGGRNDAGWDTHGNGFRDTPYLCAEVDTAWPALLEDLADRGLLDDTFVVWIGEFGRTPKLKPDGGRDHYSKGWLAAFAGGGVRGGQVIGTTDKDGIDVTDRPVSVPDLFVTYCHVLGIDPHEEYTTSDARPIKLVEGGEVIHELFA